MSRVSNDHPRIQLAHQTWRISVPTHNHATVLNGFEVNVGKGECCCVESLKASEVGIEDDCERIDKDVLGRKSAVKASKLVCTPTTEVYRAKGKNGKGSIEASALVFAADEVDCPEVDVIFLDCFVAFLLDMDGEC